jgi:hypothetical protein
LFNVGRSLTTFSGGGLLVSHRENYDTATYKENENREKLQMTTKTTQAEKIQIVEHSLGKKAKIGGLPSIMHVVINRYDPAIKAGCQVTEADKLGNRMIAYGKAYDSIMSKLTGTTVKTDVKTCSAAIGLKLLDIVSSPDVVEILVENL